MKLAAIDIGSNSIHMVVVRHGGDQVIEVVDREKDMVKLGAGAFRNGRLTDDAFAAGVDSLVKFRKIIDHHRVEQIIAVATSAVREAANGDAFLAEVKRRTGIVPRTISGIEEARLIHTAVRGAIDLVGKRALCIDIGGGSVEAVVGDATKVTFAASLALGVQRLRDRIGEDDPLTRDQRRQLDKLIEAEASAALRKAHDAGFELCVGTSGTILGLGLAVHLARGHERWISPHGRVVPLSELKQTAEELAGMDADERNRVPGIDFERTDTVHIGGLLLVRLLEMAEAESITLCDSSVREGLVIEAIEKPNGKRTGSARQTDIRRQSVMGLLRRCGQDNEHSRLISTLSLQLFDGTRTIHRFGDSERMLLDYTALMHDVGRHISFERHEQHSHYIIRHGDLLGFSNEEVDLMAIIARFHRKAKPKPRHREYAALTPVQQRMVTLHAGILRVSEGLERRHAQVIESLSCEVTPKKVRLRVVAHGDAEVEIWAAQRKSSLLARALDRRIEVELTEESRV